MLDRDTERQLGIPPLEDVWTAGFDAGGFGDFVEAPWNFEGNGAPELTSEPAFEGENAAAFSLAPGDRRQEIVAGTGPEEAITLRDGDEYYFRFATRFAADFPVTKSWQVFMQWKDDGSGSPPIAMLAGSWGRDRILLAAAGWPGGGSNEVHDLGPLTREEWINWMVRIRFAENPADAEVDVWRDEERVLTLDDWRPSFGGEPAGSEGGTLRSGRDSELKLGLYRDPAIDRRARLWFDSLAISRPQ